jgi:hypothetical protein
MFADAVHSAMQFTGPIVVSHRRLDGSCGAGIGAYVILNREGWALSAYHIFQEWETQLRKVQEYQKAEAERKKLQGGGVEKRERARRLKALPKFASDDPDHVSMWIGRDGWKPTDILHLPAADLSLFRVDGFDPDQIPEYPTFKNPGAEIRTGTSVCRLGFPFHNIEPTWEESGNRFILPWDALPIPAFPNEGIVARTVVIKSSGHMPPFPVMMFETSSPGLRGQSGGPIFDTSGRVWGIQSRTRHYPLGFNPPVPNGKPGQVEHQFLNVGWGVHPLTVTEFMKDNGVDFAVSSD